MKSSPDAREKAVTQSRDKGTAPDSLYASALKLCDPGAISRLHRWKSDAKKLLTECTKSEPKLTKAHALLSYIHCLNGDYEEAENSIRRSLRLDADNGIYLRLLLDILLAQDKRASASRWFDKLAQLEGVDVPKLKIELRQVKFPTDVATLVLNAFPNAIGWFESHLSDELEGIQQSEDDKSSPGSAVDQEIQGFRPRKLDARKVPRDLRSLIPVAQEWGIGDDVARSTYVSQASTAQKRQLRQALTLEVRGRINEWLDRFDDGAAMTLEAACFMYLLLASEEMR